MKNIEQIYRYRDSLLDRQCPKHLNTRELRNAWYESIKKEYELLTRKISQEDTAYENDWAKAVKRSGVEI